MFKPFAGLPNYPLATKDPWLKVDVGHTREDIGSSGQQF